MYNRQPAPQNDIELGPRVSDMGPGSDPENPPHYTMNPEHQAKGNSQHPVSDEPENHEVLGEPKKTSRNTPPHPSQKPFKGFDNRGFVVEDVLGSPAEASRDPGLGGPHAGSPYVTLKTSVPTFTESFYFDYTDAPRSQDAQKVMTNNITTVKECPPPLMMSAEEGTLDRAVKVVNRVLAIIFGAITFPFTCLILFLHHLIRLILQGVVRPLVVDSVMLLIEYIIHPATSGIVLPLWAAVHAILESITNTQMVLIRPVVAILRAVRLTEINCTRRSQVQTV